MNVVMLRGGLVRDPVVTEFDWGRRVEFALAINGTRWDRQTAAQVVKTIYVHCQAFANVADEFIGYALEQGDEVLVQQGELDQVKKDDTDRPSTRVTVFGFTVVRKRPRAPRPVETDTAPEPMDDPWQTG